MFTGSIVALVTPFRQGQLDEPALRRLVDWHIEQGTNALLVVGTTGESATLTQAERHTVMRITKEQSKGRCLLMAGTGSNDPQKALIDTQYAQALGYDATLQVAGYYNRPSQSGLYHHFKLIHDATDIPMIIYNIPPRVVVDIVPDTLAQLAQLPRVIGVKDATGDLLRPGVERALIGENFCWLSGDDPTAVLYNLMGGRGCISVTANVVPAQIARLQAYCQVQSWEQARTLQAALMPLHRALFLEPNPSGVKYAMSLLNLCTAQVRVPMMEVSADTQQAITEAMTALGLID